MEWRLNTRKNVKHRSARVTLFAVHSAESHGAQGSCVRNEKKKRHTSHSFVDVGSGRNVSSVVNRGCGWVGKGCRVLVVVCT